MKFKLNEKFVLSEKFKLFEDDQNNEPQNDTVDINNITANLNSAYAKLEAEKAQITKDILTPLTKYKKQFDAIIKQEKHVTEDIIKPDVIDAKNNIDNGAYITAKPQEKQRKEAEAIKNSLIGVRDAINDEANNVGELLQQYPNFNKMSDPKNKDVGNIKFDDILEFLNKINTDNDALNEKLTKILESLNNIIDDKKDGSISNLINNAKLVKVKLDSSNQNLDDSLIQQLKYWLSRIVKASKQIDVRIRNIKNILLLNLNKRKFKDLDDLSYEVDSIAKLVKTSAGEDNKWVDEFADSLGKDAANKTSKNFDKKWQEYLDIEWNGFTSDEQRIIDYIGKTFALETKVYGFSAKKNPFIHYIQNRLKQNKNFLNSIKSDHKKYDAIHDAAVSRLILENDLYSTGDLQKNNILFSNDLFNHDYKYMVEYLRLQKAALSLINNSTNDKNSTIASYKADTKQFIIDLFFEPGNITNKIEGNFQGQLKSLTEIKLELSSVFGESATDNAIDKADEAHENNNKLIVYTTKLFSTFISKIINFYKDANNKENFVKEIFDYLYLQIKKYIAENNENLEQKIDLSDVTWRTIESESNKILGPKFIDLVDRQGRSSSHDHKNLSDWIKKWTFKKLLTKNQAEENYKALIDLFVEIAKTFKQQLDNK